MTARPRPLVTAAAWQAPAAATSLLSGPGYLVALSSAGLPIERTDVFIAMGLCALTAGGPFWALVKTVLNGEKVVTPTGSEQNAAGEDLVPVEHKLLAHALVLADAQIAAAAKKPPKTREATGGPNGTSALPPQPAATRPEDPQSQRLARAADGPPSKQQHDFDYVGDRVRAYDEQRAADRGRHPAVRAGRELADHHDRRAVGRHGLRGR